MMQDQLQHSATTKMFRLGALVIAGLTLSALLTMWLLPLFFDLNMYNLLGTVDTGNMENLPAASRFFAAMQQLFTFFIPGLVFYAMYRNRHQKYVYSQWIFLYIIALNIVSIPLVEFSFYINQYIPKFWDNTSSQLTKVLMDFMLSGQGFWVDGVNVFILCFLPAVGEELVFRFGLQKHILGATRLSQSAAILITALIFSLVHLEMEAFLPRLVLALILGLSYHFSRSLMVPIAFHMFNNYLAFVQMYDPGKMSVFEPLFNQHPALSFTLVILAVFLCYHIILRLSTMVYTPKSQEIEDLDLVELPAETEE